MNLILVEGLSSEGVSSINHVPIVFIQYVNVYSTLVEWSAQASTEGRWYLCRISQVPNAELGSAVRQLRVMQFHYFLPGGEANWKEGGNGKSHV